MNTNKFDIYILKKVVILIFCLAVGVLGAGNPIIYLVIPLVLIIILINVVKIDMILEYSFWFVVLTLFLGAYLSVPGFENIYLFRLLLPLHMLLLVIFGNFKWNDFRFYFKYILLLILLLLISVCSLFVADYVELGLRYCYFMVEIICIFILCFYHLKNKKQMKKLFQIISSIFNISLVLGLVENLTGWHLWLSGSNVYVTLTSKLQPTGFLYNTNDYALFMGILYPFAAYLFLEMKHKYLGRLLYIVTTFLTLYIIISTYSRIGMLVAIISITTVYFYQFKKRGSIILFILTPALFLIIKFTSIGG